MFVCLVAAISPSLLDPVTSDSPLLPLPPLHPPTLPIPMASAKAQGANYGAILLQKQLKGQRAEAPTATLTASEASVRRRLRGLVQLIPRTIILPRSLILKRGSIASVFLASRSLLSRRSRVALRRLSFRAELTKNPVDGFSVGLKDDDNIYGQTRNTGDADAIAMDRRGAGIVRSSRALDDRGWHLIFVRFACA